MNVMGKGKFIMRFGTIPAALAVFCICMSGALAATKVDDPEKFVRDVYAHIAKQGGKYQEPDDIYTQHLSDVLALDSKEAGGEVGRLDFDFWTNSQDSELKDIKVSSKAVDNAPNRRVVMAKFKNIDRIEQIHFYFEKTKAGWKLDDMRSVGKEAWTLSLIAKYGWDDEK
jgi:hypothetical protein